MNDSRFWRIIALSMVAGIFYVGHGLHEGDSNNGLPSLATSATAAEVALSHEGQSGLYTASPDGTTIYSWRRTGQNRIDFVEATHA